ncbi:MAG: hypothetical protein RBR69_00150 [Candidatus Cloacimonadaceae bacterium]|nr:hypothetical protein [Candidatus Cloacimonadota bacterium]MDY0126534.1 hypothetical protein [Candidatus Cloacimonadaceae bacterium]MCB5255383.1 hypothetical protein [Candidatus Cloacimonadota bacterium]MCK9177532.1 hypothetical protein [Candidatus Cloacimonadota bacterium]MCK9242893.1 hypothetical protein [Candidatus Cloacimonadota bacterium]
MEQEPRSFTSQSDLTPHQNMAPVMSIGNWIVTMIILIIPLVNIIMLIVWAASSSENPNRKNWAIAQLIFMGIGIVLYILLFSTIIGLVGGMSGGY